jgi:uncharacterized membrane protein YfcA
MTIYLALALFAAGAGGGIAASVASVASVVSYPALLALGLPPLAANVTNTMAQVLSIPGSMLGSRPELAGQRDRVLRLSAVTAAGGALGAAILLLAPPAAFAYARSRGWRTSTNDALAISTGTAYQALSAVTLTFTA